MFFSVYAEKSRSPLYFVIYVPRFMVVFRSKHRQETDKICGLFSQLQKLIKALGKCLKCCFGYVRFVSQNLLPMVLCFFKICRIAMMYSIVAEEVSSQKENFADQMELLQESVINQPEYHDIHHASACGFSHAIFRMCSTTDTQVFALHLCLISKFLPVYCLMSKLPSSMYSPNFSFKILNNFIFDILRCADNSHIFFCKRLDLINLTFFRILNEPSNDGFFPLQIAADKDREEALIALLTLGANILKQDSHGCNVVHYAAQRNLAVLDVSF